MTGACDPYPPSSGAAREAFSACFPPAKETDVIRFGLKSIVNVREGGRGREGEEAPFYMLILYINSFSQYCSDIILKESPDTFTDPK